MLLLKKLKTTSVVPVSIERSHFLSLIPGWHSKLYTPEWSVVVSAVIVVTSPLVLDDLLVKQSSMESPNVVLIHTVIDSWGSSWWWVGKDRLSLDIVELKLLVSILSWDNRGDSYDVFLFGLVLLKPLELISHMKAMVIKVTQERWVVLEALMPSQERVIKELISHCSSDDPETGKTQVRKNIVRVLFHVFRESS
jgi:hypothetical protein